MPGIDLIIDKITKSVEERLSGNSFATIVQPASKADVRKLFKKDGWRFNWKREYKEPNRQLLCSLIVNPVHRLLILKAGLTSKKVFSVSVL